MGSAGELNPERGVEVFIRTKSIGEELEIDREVRGRAAETELDLFLKGFSFVVEEWNHKLVSFDSPENFLVPAKSPWLEDFRFFCRQNVLYIYVVLYHVAFFVTTVQSSN